VDCIGLKLEGVMMDDKSLTDKIYQELVDGLKTGLDWPHFLAKYKDSKGPLYNAIGRFLNDMEPKVKALNEVQGKLDQGGLKLDSLDQKIKEAESSLAPLEEKENALNEEIEALETKLTEKSQLLKHAGELAKLGFDIERLKQLQDALREIGAKQGLKGKEAVDKFFEDLKDYEAVLEAKALLEGLKNQIETKKLEAR
jgi:vacuolar-type H+-ATPase subunit I/STV1